MLLHRVPYVPDPGPVASSALQSVFHGRRPMRDWQRRGSKLLLGQVGHPALVGELCRCKHLRRQLGRPSIAAATVQHKGRLIMIYVMRLALFDPRVQSNRAIAHMLPQGLAFDLLAAFGRGKVNGSVSLLLRRHGVRTRLLLLPLLGHDHWRHSQGCVDIPCCGLVRAELAAWRHSEARHASLVG